MPTSVDPALARETLELFCQRLADPTPTPGGGSLAACLAAAGAGTVSMALRLSTGEGGGYQEGRALELDDLRRRALELVDRDAAAFDALRGAPAGEARQGALREALEAPFETMEVALAALRLAAGGAAEIDGELTVDALCGAQALWAGLEGAYLVVRANADGIAEGARAQDPMAAADAMRLEAAKLLVRVRGAAEKARG